MRAEVGIDDVRANLLPQEKLDAIRRLADSGTTVAMVGDGINDAPALATASIGFAMGGMGTHTAMEAADIVIMNDDLRRVPETIRLSQRTHAILWQNITLALGIKLVFLFLAIFDSATMWMAVFADMGASLLVVGNGLRLLRGSKTGGRLPSFLIPSAPMRRWLAVFLLVFLPLQFTWSVAAAYCQHESGNVQHFGHHEHKHAGDAGAKDAKKAPSGIDEDCAFCHGRLRVSADRRF